MVAVLNTQQQTSSEWNVRQRRENYTTAKWHSTLTFKNIVSWYFIVAKHTLVGMSNRERKTVLTLNIHSNETPRVEDLQRKENFSQFVSCLLQSVSKTMRCSENALSEMLTQRKENYHHRKHIMYSIYVFYAITYFTLNIHN